MFQQVNNKPDFPALENEITEFWKKNQIFEKSVNQKSPDNKYVFYDGPPFITGSPHYGTLLSRIAKDVIPRYQTMQGKQVERQWGWDCHGLPIETKVEAKIGLKNRREIEKFGIREFIDECYSYTRQVSADWKWYKDKIGQWVDFENSYKTMDQDYMESVMWIFKELYNKGLVYEGTRTSLYCTRCGTPVSNFEIAMDNSYAEMEDPGVTIKFPVLTPGRFKDNNILAWTTTPWTLPSNKALVIDPEENYSLVRVQSLDIELEKAWLVTNPPKDLYKSEKASITQAYLDDYTFKGKSSTNAKQVRIRRINDKYYYTEKYFAGSKKETGQLIEKNEEISKERFVELIKKAKAKTVKTRYYYTLEKGYTAEVDVYENNLKGLIIAEVEFTSIKREQEFIPPSWFDKEVTDSSGSYPPIIADKTLEEVKEINDKFTQPKHNYQDHLISEKVILAEKRISEVLKNMDYEVLDSFKGKALLGLKYQPPFSYFKGKENEYKVYAYPGMVTMDEGTGIVHSAPGFGEIDTEMGKANKIDIIMTINDEGKYFDAISDYKGMYVKDADEHIIKDLRASRTLFKFEKIRHRYPFCYRCNTPLLQKAQPSWFLNIQSLKPNLLKNNKNINWIPKHLKHGRFRKGIDMAPDWCISRTRFWATPMPVWQKVDEQGKVIERVVFGSRDEIRAKSIQPITKITFLRHAEYKNGKPTALGKSQIDAFTKLLGNEKFDAIYGSELAKKTGSISTLEKKLHLELMEDLAMGKAKTGKEFDKIVEKIKKQNNVVNLSDAPENLLQKEFAGMIRNFTKVLKVFLTKNEGKHVLAVTHQNNLVFLRHVAEGRPLNECFGLRVEKGQHINMYFLKDCLFDLHRPVIDEIKIKGKTGELTRVKEVLDVWMDSASMPYACKHYPFEDKTDFEKNFPADFVIEYIAQTRAWFYVMHVISTSLWDVHPFKNVVTTGVIFGTDGRKMSKSYGNYPDPKNVLNQYGAEALRLYLMSSSLMIGEDVNLDESGIKNQIRDFMLPLWNCYSFLVTYANLKQWKPEESLLNREPKTNDMLDQWILARLNAGVAVITQSYDTYNVPAVVKEYSLLLDDLSKWYIRRSRKRFAAGEKQAFETLYYVLLQFIKLIAPVVPFISENIYQNIVLNVFNKKAESIHLLSFPKSDAESAKSQSIILNRMKKVRDIVNIGQSIRTQNKLKVRQPLSTIEIKSSKEKLEPWMSSLILEELNIKKLIEVNKLTNTSNWLFAGSLDGKISLAVDSQVTTELIMEGIQRELTRAVQNIRKKQGLNVWDKISIALFTRDAKLIQVVNTSQQALLKDMNAKTIIISEAAVKGIKSKVNDLEIFIQINKI